MGEGRRSRTFMPRPERERASNFAGDSATAERLAGQHAHPPDPLALVALKITGSCTVTVPEWLYDRNCAGHFLRDSPPFRPGDRGPRRAGQQPR